MSDQKDARAAWTSARGKAWRSALGVVLLLTTHDDPSVTAGTAGEEHREETWMDILRTLVEPDCCWHEVSDYYTCAHLRYPSDTLELSWWRSMSLTRAKTSCSASLTLAALPPSSRFLTRPPLLTCLVPLPMGRDISPSSSREGDLQTDT